VQDALTKADGTPEPWIKTLTDIEAAITTVVGIFVSGASALRPWGTLLDLVVNDCDAGATLRSRAAALVFPFQVQAIVLGIIAPLIFWSGPIAAIVGAAATIALAASNICDDIAKQRAPSVQTLLNIAGALAVVGGAAGGLSGNDAKMIRDAANSSQAREAARSIDRTTGASTVSAQNTAAAAQDEAVRLAGRAAMIAAGQKALQQGKDPWPVLVNEFGRLKQLYDGAGKIADGIGDLIGLLGSSAAALNGIRLAGGRRSSSGRRRGVVVVRMAGGKRAAEWAMFQKNFAKLRSGAATPLPIKTNADVVRWVETKATAFLGPPADGFEGGTGSSSSKSGGIPGWVLALGAVGAVVAFRKKGR
jgi:hypothetical protein